MRDQNPRLSPLGRLRVMLVLGRVSNLPTVWSNCFAAWLLAGGGSWGTFAALCAGATLLYTGGMFLNDAFDADFDRRYRSERPIPSGQIGRGSVWAWGAAALGVGWLFVFPLGRLAGALAGALLVCIVVYDAIHKRTKLAPLLMAGCRFLLYFVAASVAREGPKPEVGWRALALAAYVAGLSWLARGESLPGATARWPLALLLVPVALLPIFGTHDLPATAAVAAVLSGWMLWCLRRGFLGAEGGFRSGISGLLAGIALVDWLAVAASGQGRHGVFFGLFLLALVLQKVAPAT